MAIPAGLEERAVRGATPCLLGQAKFAAFEEKHSLERASLSKLGYLDGVLLQEDGDRWAAAEQTNEALPKGVEKTQQIMQTYFKTQVCENTCILT